MDNVGSNGPQPNVGSEPISLEGGPGKTTPTENKPANGPAPVSRAPLNLGAPIAATTAATPTAAPSGVPAAGPVAPRAPAARPVPPRPMAAVGGSDRVTGCKTFFTKLHPGAIDFLDEQITQWLKDNPGVIIKMTNTTTGEVQGKKTESNILMTVWYHGQATKSVAHMG
ncbi:MAG: hypothetical protein ABFE13_20825 [Phycisphaerales bacterium]